MTLQGNLRVEYNHTQFELTVKTILLKGIYYFFISEPENGKGLLEGRTLELVYKDKFIDAENHHDNDVIPADVKKAVEDMLLEKKDLWHY